MSRIASDFPYDVFRFLVKPLRDGDTEGVLERYLGGVQERFEATHGRIDDLALLYDVDNCPDEMLPYLKHIVGWTRELDHITADLTPSELRRLISLSADMWKQKGTPAGIRSMLRVLTGRDAILRDWFHFRWLQGESALGQAQLERDSYVVGQDYGDRDEYLSLWYISNESDIQKQLIHDIMALNRPMLEVFQILYVIMAEDFNQGRDRWVWPQLTIADGFEADTVDAELDSSNRLVFSEYSMVRINVAAFQEEYHRFISMAVRFMEASGGQFRFLIDYQDEENYTYVQIYQDTGFVEIVEQVAGAGEFVADETWGGEYFANDTRFTFGFLDWRDTAGTRKLRVMVDGVTLLESNITRWDLDPAFGELGQFMLFNPSSVQVAVDNVIASQFNPHTDQVAGTLTDEPGGLAIGRREVRRYDEFSLWTLTGAWHTTSHRYCSAYECMYFGTGETGYYTWGVQGTMSNSNGNATSPSLVTAVASFDAERFKILLRWWQHRDVDDDPGTDVLAVQILNAANAVVGTITKSQIVDAGNGVVEFDVTNYLAGTTDHKIRFSVTSAATSNSDGWFVDDVVLLVEER